MNEDAQDSLLAALTSDYTQAELTSADRAMIDYAVLLTLEPFEVTAKDVSRLEASGFSDRAVHDICAIVSYYAFVNRIADGLGVELEGS